MVNTESNSRSKHSAIVRNKNRSMTCPAPFSGPFSSQSGTTVPTRRVSSFSADSQRAQKRPAPGGILPKARMLRAPGPALYRYVYIYVYVYIYIRRPFQRRACWRPCATLHHTSTYRHIITMPPHIPIYRYTAIATYPPQSMAIFMSLIYIYI